MEEVVGLADGYPGRQLGYPGRQPISDAKASLEKIGNMVKVHSGLHARKDFSGEKKSAL
jgi:hypothetical protein